MENVSIVAAIGKAYELGKDNKLIWHIKEDLSFYRSLTSHKNIIMGRKTFESMPLKALEKRNIFVLSSRKLDNHYDVNCFKDIKSLIGYIKLNKEEEFIVVGGSQIYEEMLPYADTMYLTEIDEYADADTFFPYIDPYEWQVEQELYMKEVGFEERSNTNVPYVRNKYVKRRKK